MSLYKQKQIWNYLLLIISTGATRGGKEGTSSREAAGNMWQRIGREMTQQKNGIRRFLDEHQRLTLTIPVEGHHNPQNPNTDNLRRDSASQLYRLLPRLDSGEKKIGQKCQNLFTAISQGTPTQYRTTRKSKVCDRKPALKPSRLSIMNDQMAGCLRILVWGYRDLRHRRFGTRRTNPQQICRKFC